MVTIATPCRAPSPTSTAVMPKEMRLPCSFASCAAHQAANVCQRARQRFARDAGGLGGGAAVSGSVAESVIAGGLRSCGDVLVVSCGDVLVVSGGDVLVASGGDCSGLTEGAGAA